MNAATTQIGADTTDTTEKTSGRRKACNECRQQKLRCDLSQEDASAAKQCGRCMRLGFECKLDQGFRRTRKRRRSGDLENQIRELREQLEASRNAPTTAPTATAWAAQMATPPPALATMRAPFAPPFFTQTPSIHSASSAVTDHEINGSHIRVPGLTTTPGLEESPRRPSWHGVPRPRAIGNVVLSVEEIDELFSM